MKSFMLFLSFILSPLIVFAGMPSSPCLEKTNSVEFISRGQDLSSEVGKARPKVEEVYVYCENKNILHSVQVFLPYGGGHPLNVAGASISEEGFPIAEVHTATAVPGGVVIRLSHEQVKALTRGDGVSLSMRLDSEVMPLPIAIYLLQRK